MENKTIKDVLAASRKTRNDNDRKLLEQFSQIVLNNRFEAVVPQAFEKIAEEKIAEITKVFGRVYIKRTMTLEVNCDDETAEEKLTALVDFITSLGHTDAVEIKINGKTHFIKNS